MCPAHEAVQDIPINITALSADMIERERLTNLADVSRRVPGMTVVDQGARGGDILTVRGLNVDSLNASEFLANSGGDTVATYVGEIPLYIDLKLNDMERVEVLIGPQGTLYGAGTLGGAVCFIPRKPDSEAFGMEVRGELYDLSESSDQGLEGGLTINVPLIANTLALRASVDVVDDPGFIDYNFLVREPGVSLPQPDFSDPEAVNRNLRWQVTLGGRYFEYENDVATGFDLPLLNTVFFGAPPDLIDPAVQANSVDDDGTLFKFNTSYHFTDDIMAFFTVSEGYRIGGVNSVPECPDPLPPGVQNVCALPDEVLIEPDKTVNYELGLHSQFGDSVLFNASLFYIDWDDIQVADVTANGGLPILTNGNSARSQGIEMAGQWLLSERLSLMGSYAYTDAELAQDAPGLVDGVDAFDGDRLAGTPVHQGSLALNYAVPLANGSELEFDWSMTATGDVLTKVGERNNGETLPGYALHNVSATWFMNEWTVTLYADNVFDKYAETSVRQDASFIRDVSGVDLRRYYKNVNRPRQTGLRVVYRF